MLHWNSSFIMAMRKGKEQGKEQGWPTNKVASIIYQLPTQIALLREKTMGLLFLLHVAVALRRLLLLVLILVVLDKTEQAVGKAGSNGAKEF